MIFAPDLCEVGEPVEANLQEIDFLQQFFRDYLNRFEVYRLKFDFQKDGFDFAGHTRNLDRIKIPGGSYHLRPLMDRMGIPDYVSIGGDFIIGHDFGEIDPDGPMRNEVGISLFDTANHGYEAFFLSVHVRAILLNIIDGHVRTKRQIQNSIFNELNAMLSGPVTQDLVHKTNPVRASRTKGVVGLHGQFHTDNGRFNFTAAGQPLFYYEALRQQFYYLEPHSGPPLGFFTSSESFYKPYDAHGLNLGPGDALILASDGCYDSDCQKVSHQSLWEPQNPIRHFRYNLDLPFSAGSIFSANSQNPEQLPIQIDPHMKHFCGVLEPLLNGRIPSAEIVAHTLDMLDSCSCYDIDDKSLLVVRAPNSPSHSGLAPL